MTIRVVVADDQPLVRAGLVMLLSAQPDVTVVAEAGNGFEALDLAAETRPDVVLMDLRMPGLDGTSATRALTRDPVPSSPDRLVKVLVLTTFGDDEAVHGALRAGASGFVLKHAAPQDLMTALRRVAGGECWIDPAVAGGVIAALGTAPASAPHDLSARLDPLTAREREVLRLMADGRSNQEITQHLVLSESTVKTHVARVIMKTGCRDRAQAVALAYQSGLVTVPTRRQD